MKNKVKKISCLSIITMIMAGTIGAGIFFKNKSLSEMAQGNFGIVLATWGIGILAMLALAVALVEITSAQKTDRGILEWVKLFCPKWVYKSSTNYIKWIFVPITLFTMPIYVTNALEDAGLKLGSGSIVLLFSFGILMWFMITNLISLRFNVISQWLFTVIQTIPLIALPIYAFINAGDFSHVESTIVQKVVGAKSGLTGVSPWLALISGISAIAFAFDGFYAPASLRSSMKEPKKIGKGLVGGIIGVSLVYIFVTIGFNVAGDGGLYGMEGFMGSKEFKMFNVFIAIGIMGVVNNFAMSSPRQFAVLGQTNETPEIVWLQKFIFCKKFSKSNARQSYVAGWLFTLLTTFILFVTLGPIGTEVYKDASYNRDNLIYAGSSLYSFSDILTNFTSLAMFVIMAAAVIGALFNRKTKKVFVEKNKWFIPAAFTFILIIFPAAIYMIIESIMGMTGYNGADVKSNIIVFSVFMLFVLISVLPSIIDLFRKPKSAIV